MNGKTVGDRCTISAATATKGTTVERCGGSQIHEVSSGREERDEEEPDEDRLHRDPHLAHRDYISILCDRSLDDQLATSFLNVQRAITLATRSRRVFV